MAGVRSPCASTGQAHSQKSELSGKKSGKRERFEGKPLSQMLDREPEYSTKKIAPRRSGSRALEAENPLFGFYLLAYVCVWVSKSSPHAEISCGLCGAVSKDEGL